MSTTTTLTTRIGSPRLNDAIDRFRHTVMDFSRTEQGTEILEETPLNNRPMMSESFETTDCQHGASVMSKEELISYDTLWESMMKCRSGVSWKPSVKQFCINAPVEILNMHTKLANGTWVNGRPKPILIAYPKKREGLSIRFPDRVFQRSINDNVLYPEMVKHFIYDNCACQKGKGPDFARDRLKKHLWNFYCNHGVDGYVLQIDITGYYPNMRHDVVKECFSRYIPSDVMQMIVDVLDQQYRGDVGYNPGSQMVQIAGISVLNPIDHFIKERLGIKHYIRYMDDFFLLHEDRRYLEHCLNEIKRRLAEIGFSVSEKKTHIRKLSSGFTFLGFAYQVTDTGKVIMTLNSDSVRHERKKLYRLVNKVKSGCITKEKADECYRAWKAHASHGNSYKLLSRMDTYYDNLWRTPQ